ncbi:hypothetical protein K493DRAFT_301945 [Basidiobolus meristosporus CBS 931.73]|uniref:Uncharacterized protein n=1 Tax=Basidiobolus meristosporus CBS 931.73 TaxID=1314790 RepID=A0A1Y1Y9E4_9FUNG|nr:hypothetical protein K493DRAFT_301945 [Basidiobolus meristosporus CBS 931.73]|eukprot:ORX94617.1 hypothetical protein K493DRAFT_301945 [Basidiobolus meristosporus CBS 931.73]
MGDKHRFNPLQSIQVAKTHLFTNYELEGFGFQPVSSDLSLNTPATPKKAVLLHRTIPLDTVFQSTAAANSDLALPEKSLCYFSISKASRPLIWPLESTIRETNLEEARKKMRMVPSFEHMLANGFVDESGHQEMTISFSITPTILRHNISI